MPWTDTSYSGRVLFGVPCGVPFGVPFEVPFEVPLGDPARVLLGLGNDLSVSTILPKDLPTVDAHYGDETAAASWLSWPSLPSKRYP